jgi:cytochrome P450 monooxygenase
MYPPTWFLYRKANVDLDVDGTQIPRGSRIVVPIIQISRNATIFPDPDTFIPDRWLDRPKLRPIETCQFGGGPHFCLGYRLALLEGIQFLVYVARELSARKLTLSLPGKKLPQARFLPLTHAPYKSTILIHGSKKN